MTQDYKHDVKDSFLYLHITVPIFKEEAVREQLLVFRETLFMKPSISIFKNRSESLNFLLTWETEIYLDGTHVEGARHILWEQLIVKSFEFWVSIKDYNAYFIHEPMLLGSPFCPFVLSKPMPLSVTKEKFKKIKEVSFEIYIKNFQKFIDYNNIMIDADVILDFYNRRLRVILSLLKHIDSCNEREKLICLRLLHNELLLKDKFPLMLIKNVNMTANTKAILTLGQLSISDDYSLASHIGKIFRNEMHWTDSGTLSNS